MRICDGRISGELPSTSIGLTWFESATVKTEYDKPIQFTLPDDHNAPASSPRQRRSRKRSQFILTDVHNTPSRHEESLCCNENSPKRSQLTLANVRNISDWPEESELGDENSRIRSRFA